MLLLLLLLVFVSSINLNSSNLFSSIVLASST